MRNVQAAFARWYNLNYERRGRFWADRFKWVYLKGKRAVLDCILDAKLNPVRAGLVQRSEEWHGSSLFMTEIGQDHWLKPLMDFFEQPTEKKALREYREHVYFRGNVPTKPCQRAISQKVFGKEIASGFAARGLYREGLGYFVDGLAIGTEVFIRDQLARLRKEGRYKRRKNPIPQLGGIHLSWREQRTTAVTF